MINFRKLLVLAILTGSHCVYATESLLDLYNLALDADPTLRQSQFNVQIATEEKRESLSRWLPTVDFSGDFTNNSQKRTYDVSQFDGEEKYKSYGYSFSINQPLFRYENSIIYQQAKDKIKQSSIQLQLVKQALIIRISEAYFKVLAAEDNLRFIEIEKNSVDRQLAQANGRLKAGLSAITDVYEAQALLDSTIANAIKAQNRYENSLESLREITNRYHEKIKPLLDNINLTKPLILGIKKWEKMAVDSNLEIITLRHRNEQLRGEINRQRAGHYPTLDLVARQTRRTTGGGNFGESNTLNRTIALQINFPLYRGGGVISRTKIALLKYENNLEKLEATTRSVKSQAHKAYLGIMANIAQVKSLSQTLSSTKKALNAIEEEYKLGMRTVVDVFQATKKLYRTRRDYQRSRYDYILNRLRLKQSIGRLSEMDLEHIDSWLVSS